MELVGPRAAGMGEGEMSVEERYRIAKRDYDHKKVYFGWWSWWFLVSERRVGR